MVVFTKNVESRIFPVYFTIIPLLNRNGHTSFDQLFINVPYVFLIFQMIGNQEVVRTIGIAILSLRCLLATVCCRSLMMRSARGIQDRACARLTMLHSSW